MFSDSDKYEVQSAGFRMIDGRSGQLVTQELVNWANIIFVMDEKYDTHLTRLCLFNLGNKKVFVLDIRDVFDRKDPMLRSILIDKLAKHGILR